MEASEPPTSSSNGRQCLSSSTSPPTIGGAPNMLDLVFCIDSTGSMGPFIRAVQDNTCQIVETLIASEKCDIRFGLVAYRDHPPQDFTFITRKFEFTSSCSTMRANVDTLKAKGGGDEPESVCCGLYDVLHMDWRKEATKIVILIADAPPHGIHACGDGFPNGCPDGRDPIAIGHKMAEQGICVYTVGCGRLDRHRYAHAFMVGLAEMTHGQAVTLASAQQLVDVILGGAQEELVLERLMPVMERERAAVVRDIGARRRRSGAAAVISEESEGFQEYQEEVLSAVHERMTSMEVQTRHLSHNSSISAPHASTLAGSRSLDEWRSTVKPPPPAPTITARRTSSFRPARSTGLATVLFGTPVERSGRTRELPLTLESESCTDDEPPGGVGGGRGGGGRGGRGGRGGMSTYSMKSRLFCARESGRGSDLWDLERSDRGADRSERGGFTSSAFASADEGRASTSGASSRGWSEPATKVMTRTESISTQQVSRMMAKSYSRSCTKDDVGV